MVKFPSQMDLANGKNQYRIFFYGKLFNFRNRTFSLENGENFIEGTGHCYSKRKEAKLPLFLAPCFLQLIFFGPFKFQTLKKYQADLKNQNLIWRLSSPTCPSPQIPPRAPTTLNKINFYSLFYIKILQCANDFAFT